LKGLKSKVIFWVERAGLFVPLKIHAFHSRGPIVAAAGAFWQGMKLNFLLAGPIVQSRHELAIE
jgi:hypothetical protein